jgi:dephospho-CoA kinase
LHPRVRARLWSDLERIEREQPGCVVVLDVPLLVEGGLAEICDFLVFVEANDDLRAARACARHGWSREEWQRREAAQATPAEKRTRADAILHNDTGIEELRAQCAVLAPRLRGLPTRPLRVRWPAPEEAPPSQGTH